MSFTFLIHNKSINKFMGIPSILRAQALQTWDSFYCTHIKCTTL